MSVFPTSILLATDGSSDAWLASRTAADLAERTGSELHVVLVAPLLSAPEYDAMAFASAAPREEVEREGRRQLDAQVKRIEGSGATVAGAHFRTGRSDERILALAEEIGAGLIVVGSRGLGGISRALIGSVSDSVVRHAHCPVLVVRETKGARSEV
jgi:nucleotide-binding universal stress UspA family protein